MAKLIAFHMTTLDGKFEGEGGSLDWHMVDEEFGEFAEERLKSVGTIVFGRVTYEGMASYWQTPEAHQADPEIAALMNSMPKVVCSRTLESADWENTTLVRDGRRGLTELKATAVRDLIIFGSSNLCADLAAVGLVDELRLMVCPLLLGEGTALFEGTKDVLKFALRDVHTFGNGNVLLTYAPGN